MNSAKRCTGRLAPNTAVAAYELEMLFYLREAFYWLLASILNSGFRILYSSMCEKVAHHV
jgi:hypothetical protein